VKYFRIETFLCEKLGEVFKQISVFLRPEQKDRIAELGKKVRDCVEIIGAKVRMVEYESVISVYEYSKGNASRYL
jgi:hypothetical protein